MRNRHGLLPKEADRLLETISESWNLKINEAEQSSINQPMQGHSRRHYQAIMAALICLQKEFDYDTVLTRLQKQVDENLLLIHFNRVSDEVKTQLSAFNIMASALIKLFRFLQASTFQL